MKKILAIVFIGSLAMSACTKKQEIKVEENSIPTAANADENTMGDSDSGKAMGLQTIHFPYDAFTLDSEAKAMLKAASQILKDKPSIKIQIEGHCDIRGGIQYNLALGEKRANAVKKYLIEQGMKAPRLATISFGKERLVAQGETEEAHAKNRRANFVITAR